MKKISIIIPIYNSEDTIDKCIDSVFKQTYSNWELILVNDGSTDRSLEKCKKLCDKNEKVIIISQKNKGVSFARNKGIDVATGDYIMFVDSDDYIEPNLVEIISNKLREEKWDLLVFGYRIINNMINKEYTKIPQYTKLYKKEDILKYMGIKDNFFYFAAPHGKIFDKKIINNNNTRFNEKMDLGEDTCFVLDYINKINTMHVLEQNLYNTIQVRGSLSRRDRKNIWDTCKIIINSIFLIYQDDKYTKERDKLAFQKIKIPINTAILYKWTYEEYGNLCFKIWDSKEFKKIHFKNLDSLYDKIFYILIKHKKIYILKTMLNLITKT